MTKATLQNLINKIKEGEKIYVITHNDLDGVGSAKVASVFLNVANIDYCTYRVMNDKIDAFCNELYKEYDGLVIADSNLNMIALEKLDKLARKSFPIMYFDHHSKSPEQFEFLKKSRIMSEHSKDFCATSLMLNFFTANEFTADSEVDLDRLNEIVSLIDAWDLYKWRDPETYEIINDDANSLNIYFSDNGIEKTVMKFDSYLTRKFKHLYSSLDLSNISLIKRDLKRTVNFHNKRLLTMQYPFEGEILDIGVVFEHKYVSELGNCLNIYNKHLSFIVIVDMPNNSVNFRTIFDKPDLSKVAAIYGGGGHPKAAGCNLNEKAFNAFVNRTLSRDQLNMILAINAGKTIETDSSTETEVEE